MTKPSVDRIIRDSRDGCLVLSQGEAKVMVDEIVRLREALRQIAAGHSCTKPALREAAADALRGSH